MISVFLLIQVIVVLTLSGVTYYCAPHHLTGFFAGGMTMVLDVVLNAVIVWRLAGKKNVAITASVIIGKYVILIGIVFVSIRQFGLSELGFGLGIGTVIPAAIVKAVWLAMREKNSETMTE